MVATLPRSLTRVRQVLTYTFDVDAIIRRKTRTGDSAGGAVETWANVTTCPCTFSAYPIRDVERETGTRIQALSFWQFVFAYDADVRVEDRVVVDTRTFEVTGGGVGSMGLSKRLLCVEIF